MRFIEHPVLETVYRKHGCRLCESAARKFEPEIWNQPLFESENFVVIPSLGSLVDGWLMIVPRAHFLSAACQPDHLMTEMDRLKGRVCDLLNRTYGPVFVFEHGPSSENTTTGCGVDHAHVHIVPIAGDLIEATTPFLPAGSRFRSGDMSSCRAAIRRGSDYLYAEAPGGSSFVATSRRFESQTFRKALAAMVGVPDEFNWRHYSHLKNIAATVAKLSALDENSSASNAAAA